MYRVFVNCVEQVAVFVKAFLTALRNKIKRFIACYTELLHKHVDRSQGFDKIVIVCISQCKEIFGHIFKLTWIGLISCLLNQSENIRFVLFHLLGGQACLCLQRIESLFLPVCAYNCACNSSADCRCCRYDIFYRITDGRFEIVSRGFNIIHFFFDLG